MSAPGGIDPVLAFMEFLEGYRRSRRCWLLGGPAAVDDLALRAAGRSAGIRINADFETELRRRARRHVLKLLARRRRWYAAPDAEPPDGFANRSYAFAFAETRAAELCAQCGGGGERPCPACDGGAMAGDEPCSLCEGKGKVPCACSDRASPLAVLRYQEERIEYRHEAREYDILLWRAARREVAALFARAWKEPRSHRALEAGSANALAEAIRGAGLGDADLLRRAARVCGLIEQRAAHRPGRRLIRQRLRARLAHAASVETRLGGIPGHFWAIGTAGDYQAGLLDIEGAALGDLLYRLSGWAQVVLIALVLWWLGFRWPGQLLAMLACLLLVRASLTDGGRRGVSREDRRAFLRYLAQSRHARPAGTLVVIGADARASGCLFALLPHLAASAQLADPAQGGAVETDAYPDLFGLLHHEPAAPVVSAAYRMRFETGGEPQLTHVIHAVCPPGEMPDALCERTLRRAGRVWVVLPAGDPSPEADRLTARLLGEAAQGGAEVTLVIDGADAVPDAFTATREVLERLTVRCWPVDLAGLRRAYLAGGIAGQHAGDLVRWLLDGSGPAPAVQEGVLPLLNAFIGVPAPTEGQSRETNLERGQMAS